MPVNQKIIAKNIGKPKIIASWKGTKISGEPKIIVNQNACEPKRKQNLSEPKVIVKEKFLRTKNKIPKRN